MNNLDNILNIIHVLAIYLPFLTFMSINPDIFVLQTLYFTHIHAYFLTNLVHLPCFVLWCLILVFFMMNSLCYIYFLHFVLQCLVACNLPDFNL